MATVATGVLAVILAACLPAIPKAPAPRHRGYRGTWRQAGTILGDRKRDGTLIALLIGAPAMFCVTYVMVVSMQARLNTLVVPPEAMGILLPAHTLVMAGFASVAYRILAVLGERRVMLMLPLALLAGSTTMLVMDTLWLTVVGSLVGSAFVFAIGKLLSVNLICHRVQAGARATMLSVATLVERVGGGAFMALMAAAEEVSGTKGVLAACVGCAIILAWATMSGGIATRRTM